MKYVIVFLLLGLIVSCGDDASGDATGDAKYDKKTETAKQPNCDEIEGLQIEDYDLVPEDYTGIVFRCQEGKIKELIYFKEGKEDGLARIWNLNGQLMGEGNYKDGKQDGLSRSWHSNGQLQSEWNLKDGKADGLSKVWNENGHLEQELNYLDGIVINGKCWDEDGNKIECPEQKQ